MLILKDVHDDAHLRFATSMLSKTGIICLGLPRVDGYSTSSSSEKAKIVPEKAKLGSRI